VDGTLLDFADHPDAVVVGVDLVALLQGLHRALGGALALVSGRSIASLDLLFAPFRGTAVGLHGLELRRDPKEPVVRAQTPPVPEPLMQAVRAIVAAHPGPFIEDKGFAVAIHHRLAAPGMQSLRRRLRAACARHAPGWTVMRGRQVLEIKPEGATKAHGVDALMCEQPFRGTWPLAFGDDITDLDMFEAIKRHGGTTVSVGPRIASAGDLQLASPGGSDATLRAILAALEDGGSATHVLGLLGGGVGA
jgi:trehalose 6-phosphate phosphatase